MVAALIMAGLLNVKLYGPTLCTHVTDHFQNHGPLQHNDIIVPVNAMISSCCEVRDDIVGHDRMIWALTESFTCSFIIIDTIY